MKPIGHQAIVIGAGIGGLLAARALVDHYDRVTVLERDAFPPVGEHRKGVPQGRHAHALLVGGRKSLEVLFPGITQQLIEQGMPKGYGRFFSGGGYHCRIRGSLASLFISRPRLEAELRARVLALPKVRIIENRDVVGFSTDEVRTTITGVRVIDRQAANSEEILPANLVVDASGRGSRTPVWLEALGCPSPPVKLIEVGMGYATRVYRREPNHLQGDLMVNVAPTAENRRACGMLAQEGDRWIVTLAGYFGDYPSLDEQSFLEFARSLPTPDVYEVSRSATPLSAIVSFRFSSNQRRYYERVSRFPEGLLVIGDAIASFTPIYGQGMTVAAFEALALRECLTMGDRCLAQRFFKQASKAVDVAWNITVGNDLRLAGAKEAFTPMKRVLNWYMGKLQLAARYDPEVASAFRQVGNLLAPLPSLLGPRIALRVLFGKWRSIRKTSERAYGTPPASSSFSRG